MNKESSIARSLYSPDKNKSVKLTVFLVTYTQAFKERVQAGFEKIAKQYAAVHLCEDYSASYFEECCENHVLSKRTINFIVMKQWNQKSQNMIDDIMKYQEWFHYGQIGADITKPSNLTVFDCQDLTQQQIYQDASKNLQLNFVWVGVACRLGGSLSQFVQALIMNENFQTNKTEFMITFFKILNNYFLQGQSQRNNPEQIYQILQKCTIQAEKTLSFIEEKIQKLVCQKFNVRTIVSGITEHRYLRLLKSRNYFKVVWIQESTMIRFSLFKDVLKDYGLQRVEEWLNLQNFILLDDYWYQKFTQKVAKDADFTINRNRNQPWGTLIQKNYSNIISKFRPDFDEYFLEICEILKTRAGCIKQAVGAIIVKNKRIVSTGYNGTPMGSINCFNGGCRVCDNSQVMNTIVLSCNCIHAEYSCILEAGIQITPGCTLYTTKLPCLWCSKVIIQARIATVIYIQTQYPHLAYPNQQKVREIFKEAKVTLRQFRKNDRKFSK